MLINEVITTENTSDFSASLLAKVQDILAVAMARDCSKGKGL